MLRFLLCIVIMMLCATQVKADAQKTHDSIANDTAKHIIIPVEKAKAFIENTTNSVTTAVNNTVEKTPFLKKIVNAGIKVFEAFDEIDTAYVEPQKYNFTVMLQNTNSYEYYRLNSENGQSILFQPRSEIKIGPYFGWRWIFLGYTIDVNNLDHSSRKQFNLSLYTSMIGADIFYRRSGRAFYLKEIETGNGTEPKTLSGVSFPGLDVGVTGFNLYYIFNHKKFSYPAAFSQSTIQKRSAGTATLGIGYSRHSLEIDYEDLDNALTTNFPEEEIKVDSNLVFSKIKYSDYSIQGGYAYNWVICKNFLFSTSLSIALGYKHSWSDTRSRNRVFKDFSVSNFNVDGILRTGIVYNNMKWYAGASAILNLYKYKKKNFSTTNLYGNMNIYVGFNFGKKKKYK